MVEETRRHRSNVEVLSGSVARVVDEDRDSRRTIAEKLDGLAETLSVHRQALDGALESRGVTSAQVAQALVTLKGAIDDVAGKVGMIHRRVEQSEPSEVDRHAAVIGVIDALLNDVSVAATGIVVRLMEAERQPKRDIRAFVQGLVNAYASGDKHVFFRVLNSRLAESPERMALLREQVSASPEVAKQLSKMLRETKEIVSLVRQRDEGDLVRLVYDDALVQAFCVTVERNLTKDATAKPSSLSGRPEPTAATAGGPSQGG